jgi:hypothetical protein
MGERQVFQSDGHRPPVARDFLTDKAGDDDLEAARRAGRAVFRHLESFCEQLIDNFGGAARHGLTLTRGIAALTLLPLRAFWRPAIPDCVISASIVALSIHAASDSSQFQSGPSSGRPPIQRRETLGAFARFKGACLRTTRTRSTRPRKRVASCRNDGTRSDEADPPGSRPRTTYIIRFFSSTRSRESSDYV